MKCNKNKACQQEVIRIHSSPKNLFLHLLTNINLQSKDFEKFYLITYLDQNQWSLVVTVDMVVVLAVVR